MRRLSPSARRQRREAIEGITMLLAAVLLFGGIFAMCVYVDTQRGMTVHESLFGRA